MPLYNPIQNSDLIAFADTAGNIVATNVGGALAEVGTQLADKATKTELNNLDDTVVNLSDNIYKITNLLTVDKITSVNCDFVIEAGVLKIDKLAEIVYTYAAVLFPALYSEFNFKFIKTETIVLIGGSETDFTGMWIGSTNIRLGNLGASGTNNILNIPIADTPVLNDILSFRWVNEILIAKKNSLDWFTLDFNQYPQYYCVSTKRFGSITTETTRRSLMQDANIMYLNDKIDQSKIETVSPYEGSTWNPVGDSVTFRYNYQPIVSEEFNFVTPINYGVSGCNIAQKIGYLDGESIVERVPSIPDAELWTIFGGYNDWATARSLGDITSTDPVTFYGALNIICQNILQRPNRPRLILITPAQSNRNGVADMTNLTMLDYVNAIKAIGQYYSIQVLDLYTHSGINPLNLSYYTDDGLHPNLTYGMPLIATKIIKAIKDM